MNPKAWLIALSLVANAALAGWWFKGPAISATPLPSTVTVSSPATTTIGQSNSANAPVSPVVRTVQTGSWKDIQSAELKEFVRRLRAAGCPEETVQDIILAEVNRLYAGKLAQIWPDRGTNQPFWKVNERGPIARQHNRENQHAARLLQKEKSALLVELLGVDPEKLQNQENPDSYQIYKDARVAFLPESKRQAVSDYLDDFQERQTEFYQTNWGYRDAQYSAESKKLDEEQLQGLAKFLTPEEIREYELRNSNTASEVAWQARNMPSLTRSEYETLYDITKKYYDSISGQDLSYNTKEGRQKLEDAQKAMRADISASLGPALDLEYHRSADYEYQGLNALVSHYQLPAETVNQVYNVKDAVDQSLKDLRADTTLTPEQRDAARKQIAQETETKIRNTLGPQYYKDFLRNGGGWLNRIAPPPPAPPH